MLRIALVNELHNFRQGGVHHSTTALRSTLEKLGAEVEIFAIKKRGRIYNSLITLPYFREFIVWPLWNHQLINRLDRQKFDVALYRGTTSLLFTRRGHLKKVIYTRGLLERQLNILKRLKIPVYLRAIAYCLAPPTRLAEHVSLRRADRVVASKPVFAQYVAEHFGIKESKIIVLPQMIDFSTPAVKVRKSYDLLFVGRLSAPKNWPLVAELAATGKYKIAVAVPEEMESQPTTPNATFFFKLDYSAMPRLFAAAKIFVMPSFAESGPRVTLEAMACGLPVVASPDGSGGFMKDGKNGYIITNSRVADYEQAIDRLLTDAAARKKMGSLNRRVSKNYSTTHLGPKYLEALTFKNAS